MTVFMPRFKQSTLDADNHAIRQPYVDHIMRLANRNNQGFAYSPDNLYTLDPSHLQQIQDNLTTMEQSRQKGIYDHTFQPWLGMTPHEKELGHWIVPSAFRPSEMMLRHWRMLPPNPKYAPRDPNAFYPQYRSY